jgi:hypothetical protein
MTFFPARRSTLVLALSSSFLCVAAFAAESSPKAASSSGVMADSKAAAGVTGQLLCAPGQTKAAADGLGWYDTGRGLTLGSVKAGQACTLLATGAGLNLQFAGQGPLLLAGPVNYRLNQTPRRADFSLAEPVLCESYSVANNKLALQITDTNGAVQLLRGFNRVDYAPGNSRFLPESVAGSFGPMVQCYAFPFSSLIANPPTVPAPPPVDPNRIFGSGFDDSVSLTVELLTGDGANAIRQLDVARDQPFEYQIRVTNTGAVAASGVRIREFVPTPATTPLLSPVVTAGTWSCSQALAPCSGTASGTGVLNQSGISIGPGQSRVYTLSRTVSSGAPPEKTLLGAAVFFDPDDVAGGGDRLLTDNSAPLVLNLVPNQGPMIACAGLPSPVNLNENASAVEFECALTDPEEDIITGFTVQNNSNPAVIPDAGMLTPAAAPDTWTLRLAPITNALGTAVVTLRATDDRGGSRDLTVTVNVNDVNSPPSFSLKGSVIEVPTGPGLPRIFNQQEEWVFVDVPEVGFGAGCDGTSTCVITFPGFVLDRSVGAPPELPQTLTPSVSCTQTGSGSAFLEPNSWAIAPAAANSVAQELSISFKYRRSAWQPAPSADAAATCTVTLTDSGSPQLSLSRTLIVRYLQ